MKKIIYLIASVLLLTPILVGCSNVSDPIDDTESEDTVVFEATVIEDNSGLLVTPIEGSDELKSSDKIYVSLSSSKGQENKTSGQTGYKPGDIIKITYNGLIDESYPAQITASEIELIGSISKWRSGDGAIGWTVQATNKDGQWWITRDNSWIS